MTLRVLPETSVTAQTQTSTLLCMKITTNKGMLTKVSQIDRQIDR
jgi:hypothetical protein